MGSISQIMSCLFILALGLAQAAPVRAGDVEIVDVVAERTGDTWRISVTLRHGDEGWDHYADLWQVTEPDGTILGERVLLHPHVNEQPFTRSLDGVVIPPDLRRVAIRARDSVHGFGAPFELVLP